MRLTSTLSYRDSSAATWSWRAPHQRDFTIDQYHPDLENLDPEGHRDELTGMNRLASNGLIADPCGVPRSRATRVPSG
jgi:hypothetical protein